MRFALVAVVLLMGCAANRLEVEAFLRLADENEVAATHEAKERQLVATGEVLEVGFKTEVTTSTRVSGDVFAHGFRAESTRKKHREQIPFARLRLESGAEVYCFLSTEAAEKSHGLRRGRPASVHGEFYALVHADDGPRVWLQLCEPDSRRAAPAPPSQL